MAKKPSLTFDLSTGVFKQIPSGPGFTPADIEASKELLGRGPEPGESFSPSIAQKVRAALAQRGGHDILQGGGWGTPVYQRSRYYDKGPHKGMVKSVWAIPAGFVIGAVAVWGLERLVVDASHWWPASALFGKPRPVASFPTWLASWIVPNGADIHALSATIQSASTGNAPSAPPQPPAPGSPSLISIIQNGITYVWNGLNWVATIG